MSMLTKPATREIIEDFAKEIQRNIIPGNKPPTTIINFRNDIKNNFERPVDQIPIELLRYRKDNGRIATEVIDFEKNYGRLEESDEKAQRVIRGFLEAQNKDKTEELASSIIQDGQREPTIITCDGFLINGNRRKMVMEMLSKKYPGKYTTMNVVILPPNEFDNSAPPTLIEINQIENRYQLQSDGKAEYSDFNQALSMRRKIEEGMSLQQQLQDDPRYAHLDPDSKEFKSAERKVYDKYLGPLKCIDAYLKQLKRENLYGNISIKSGDREGRWQAFVDYYMYVYKKITDERERIKLGLDEDMQGKVQNLAFNIIRKREFPNMTPNIKVHKIMRELPKLLENKDARKELFKINDIPEEIDFQEEDDLLDGRKLDKIWGNQHGHIIVNQVKKAFNLIDNAKDKETPIALLKNALQKLNHEKMITDSINISDIEKAMDLAEKIEDRASDLRSEFDKHRQERNKLKRAFSSPINKN